MNFFSRMSPRRKRLVLGTAGAFAACAALPGTGPSLRHNLSGAVQSVVNWFHEDDNGTGDIKNAANPSPAVFRARLPLDQDVAAKMPGDFAVQLAVCERSVPSDSGDAPPPSVGRNERIAHKLHDTLEPRFNENPAFHAAVLRNLAFDAVRLNNRNDASVFDTFPAPKNHAAPPTVPPPTPDNLRLWHDAAKRGSVWNPETPTFP